MRRLLPLAVLLALVTVLAGCGGGETVSPAPETVVGSLPQAAKGDPAAGKSVFEKQGCGSCHTFQPAGSNGKVGPDLDNLAADAEKANQGSVEEYTSTSIRDPGAYVVSGFPNGVMPSYTLPAQDLADLVAFLTQSQG